MMEAEHATNVAADIEAGSPALGPAVAPADMRYRGVSGRVFRLQPSEAAALGHIHNEGAAGENELAELFATGESVTQQDKSRARSIMLTLAQKGLAEKVGTGRATAWRATGEGSEVATGGVQPFGGVIEAAPPITPLATEQRPLTAQQSAQDFRGTGQPGTWPTPPPGAQGTLFKPPLTRQFPIRDSASVEPETKAALTTVYEASKRVDGRLAAAAKRLVTASEKSQQVGRGMILAGVAQSFGQTPEQMRKEFDRRVASVRALANDPAHLASRLEPAFGDLHPHAPEVAAAGRDALIRSVKYLESQIPQPTRGGPLGPMVGPNLMQMMSFNRKWEAVNDPGQLLTQAAAGTLTKDAVDTVAATNRSYLTRARMAVLDAVAANGPPPITQWPSINMLMGVNLFSRPASVGAQSVYAPPPVAPNAPSAKTGGKKSTGTARQTFNANATGAQRVSQGVGSRN